MRPTKNTRKAQQGYTLVEVMMAVAIMTVGSVGIMSLQQATINGNRGAREMATATDLTRVYLERVRRDALLWTASGSVVGTELLINVPVSPTAAGAWFIPSPGIGSYGFDYAGRDIVAGVPIVAANMYYCTNLRARWIIGQDAIRVDARVWWHRTASNTVRTAFNCDSDPALVTSELAEPDPSLRVVTASTVVRWQRVP